MASKKFEINLTPQNEEWVKLIPSPSQNMDILFNKLIDSSINDGLFLEIISQSLNLVDLSKFKTAYSKMNKKRAEYIAELEIKSSVTVEKRKNCASQLIEEEISIINNPKPPNKPIKKEPKMSHGFSEDSF